MLPDRAISGYFRLLTFTGVLPISLTNNRQQITSTKLNKRICLLIFILTNGIILEIFISNLTIFQDVEIHESSTSKDMQVLQEYLACIFNTLTHSWMYFHKDKIFDILKIFLNCKLKLRSNKFLKSFYQNLKIFILSNLFYHVNNIGVFLLLIFNWPKYILESLNNLAGHGINFLLSTLILSFYTSLVGSIQNTLEEINERLLWLILNCENYLKYSFEICELLKIRNTLLVLCKNNISDCFGAPLVFITIFSVLPVVHVITIFLWNYTYDGSVINFIINLEVSSYFILPSLVVHLRAFGCNRMRREVRFLS